MDRDEGSEGYEGGLGGSSYASIVMLCIGERDASAVVGGSRSHMTVVRREHVDTVVPCGCAETGPPRERTSMT